MWLVGVSLPQMVSQISAQSQISATTRTLSAHSTAGTSDNVSVWTLPPSPPGFLARPKGRKTLKILFIILLLIPFICRRWYTPRWSGHSADRSHLVALIHILFDNAAGFVYINAVVCVTLSADGYCCTPVDLVAQLAGREVAFAAKGLDRPPSAHAYSARDFR